MALYKRTTHGTNVEWHFCSPLPLGSWGWVLGASGAPGAGVFFFSFSGSLLSAGVHEVISHVSRCPGTPGRNTAP